jgi:tripartite-type tricarboxylate transporter receptor subunit TctC
MKRFVFVVTLWMVVCGLDIGAADVQAQPYPNRPIQLIIPIPAGGGGDVTGRLVAEELGKILKMQVIVTNKAGAGNALGTEFVAKSKKDGYTIGYTSSAAIVYAPIMNPENVTYDMIKDFDPLGLHVFFASGFAVQESSPWKTFPELLEYAKKNPGKIRVSTPGLGSTVHFNLEMIQSMTGTQLTHIPYKGGEAVITALLGGHVEATFDAIGKIMPHAEAGKMRVLLLTKKFSQFPNVPTITELGYKEDLLSAWFAFYAPAGIPEEFKQVLVPAIEKAIRVPDVKAKIERMGYVVEYKSPADLKKVMVTDYETARSIATKLGMSK